MHEKIALDGACIGVSSVVDLVLLIISCVLTIKVISGQSMAREREERLGVAEYELRVALEDNKELKVASIILLCLNHYCNVFSQAQLKK